MGLRKSKGRWPQIPRDPHEEDWRRVRGGDEGGAGSSSKGLYSTMCVFGEEAGRGAPRDNQRMTSTVTSVLNGDE